MLFSQACSFALFLTAAVAAPLSLYEGHTVHERRDYSEGWHKRERVRAGLRLPVRIGLTQRNLEHGDKWLMDVSSPDSPRYGSYYSAEEVTDMFAPALETVEAVKAWLHASGVAPHRISQSVNKQWLQFDAQTQELEALLKTQFHHYEHERANKGGIACEQYHLPQAIQRHVDYITPGTMLLAEKTVKSKETDGLKPRTSLGRGNRRKPPPMLPNPVAMTQVQNSDLSLCDSVISPPCIMALYNITLATHATRGNDLGIFEDLGDVYSQEDLNLFFKTLQPRIPQGTHPVLDLIDGAVAPVSVAEAGAESDLDFQISYPIIWPQNSVLYQTDDPIVENNYYYEGFLNNFFDAIDGSYCTYSAYGETGNSPIDPSYPDSAPGGYKGKLQCGVYSATHVISISYGGAEADAPISYQRRQCNEILKLGLQGISVVVSSGDAGVASDPPDDPGPNGCLGAGNIFAPDFPATCPYITALGSTYLPPGANVSKDEEVATTRFPSGGGFSNIYAQPAYQEAAVQEYLTKYDPGYPSYSSYLNDSFGADGGIYNRAGRAYPDFAAIGDNVLIYNTGRSRLIGGTSASAPAFASILTRINQHRLDAGKSTIGFVNPVLYANPEVLHDITVGNNSGCGTPGFFAQPGWDPVTGYGTPNYPAMLALFLSLP